LGFHYGIDIAVPMNTPVQATKDGIVTYAAYDEIYGWRVEITHAGGWLSFYAHNTVLLVKVGQHVDKGAIIALSGTTGASTGPHVHYEIHLNGKPVDPALYIKVPLHYAYTL
jgi:murein DD-endopeptidase MepM/ murein hydrolase activator NlpD